MNQPGVKIRSPKIMFNRDLKEKVERALLPYLDTITEKVNRAIDRGGAKAAEVLADDARSTEIFRGVYGRLPLVLRMAVKESAFVDFCMRHRQRFVVAGNSAGGNEGSDPRNEGS